MLHDLLKDRKLILASASPRRKEIFQMLGLNPLIVPADMHEPIDERPPRLIVQSHAMHKAELVCHKFAENTLIVAADTLVYINGTVLGKPANKEEAKLYLAMLSGHTHTVYTGVCIQYGNVRKTDYEKSRVNFMKLSEDEIKLYVNTGEPMDKAGAYGIQGYGSQFITSIRGCYFNVMGFPVHLFYVMLREIL
jgi:septum formation protein